ncbi:glycoside hydrolase superfamily [Armillaria nabsnona]|nr:glycoside hydrolase superfamily [Armillaria nabsnona]
MTVPELVMQLHLMFADNVVGPRSEKELYADFAMKSAPTAGIGVIHDWYPTDRTYYNTLQKFNRDKSRLGVPFMQLGECIHGVGSFKQSMFPQAVGTGASFDREIVYKVGRAIGEEARAIEAWGEDFVLTSHMGIMGVAFASGLSKNGSWGDPDAVAPVMKATNSLLVLMQHFAAHGSPHGEINAASFMDHGLCQVMMEMLVPVKAAFELGGARGFIMADDTGMRMLNVRHTVSNSPADTIQQWFNAGGNLQFYDYDLPTYLNCTIDLIENGTVAEFTLRSHARRVLKVKYDFGLFSNPYIPDGLDYNNLTTERIPFTLDAARRSIVLLENKNSMLPIRPMEQGSWGEYPVANLSTIRQAMKGYLSTNHPNVSLVSSWGADTWMYAAQHAIPGYLLSSNGTPGGLLATYYFDTNSLDAVFQVQEQPDRSWGIYPPLGLPSNNFSVVWEGELEVPVDGSNVDGYICIAVYANNMGRLCVDDVLVAQSELSDTGTVMGNIQSLGYVLRSCLFTTSEDEYSFRYGLSYTTFSVQNFNATSNGGVKTFTSGETITFRMEITNEGNLAGSYVAQVYLLVRVSAIVHPQKQLVAFNRVYLNAGQTKVATMELEVDSSLLNNHWSYPPEDKEGDSSPSQLTSMSPVSSKDTIDDIVKTSQSKKQVDFCGLPLTVTLYIDISMILSDMIPRVP